MLREIIRRTGAHSTNLESRESVEGLCSRCDHFAKHWQPETGRLWEENTHIVEFVR